MSTKTVPVKPLTLSSSIGTSNTTAIVSGMIGLDGADLAQADFGTIIYGTFEPNTDREEAVSFTITSNTDGVAEINFGVSGRGLIGKAPYGTGGITYTHAAGAKLVISNNPNLFNKFTAKDNDEVISGAWEFPEPVEDENPATKSYTDTKVAILNGAVVHLEGDEEIAGEKTFTTAPKIPNSSADDEAVTREEFDDEAVVLTGNQTIAGVKTFSSSPVVPDATAANQPYTKGQHDADAEAFSAVASPTVRGTAKLDIVADNVLDPEVLTATADRVGALEGVNNTPDALNPFVTKDDLSDPAVLPPQVVTFTSSGTWTKDAGLKYIIVEVQAAGGGSGGLSASQVDGSGAGAGGYGRKLILASALAATETVTVGVGGTAGAATPSTNGGDGGASSFGSHIVANGGSGSVKDGGAAGTGGTCTGGDLNIKGQDGGKGGANGGTSGGPDSGLGGSSILGLGGQFADNANGTSGTGYGAGAGGAQTTSSGDRSGGVGTNGIVIVTEYYS